MSGYLAVKVDGSIRFAVPADKAGALMEVMTSAIGLTETFGVAGTRIYTLPSVELSAHVMTDAQFAMAKLQGEEIANTNN